MRGECLYSSPFPRELPSVPYWQVPAELKAGAVDPLDVEVVLTDPELVYATAFEYADLRRACAARGFSESDLQRLDAAWRLMALVSIDKTRDSGELEIFHPLAVALTALLHHGERRPDVIIALLLHDTIEDAKKLDRVYPTELIHVQLQFGLLVSLLVEALSKPDIVDEMDKSVQTYVYQQHVYDVVIRRSEALESLGISQEEFLEMVGCAKAADGQQNLETSACDARVLSRIQKNEALVFALIDETSRARRVLAVRIAAKRREVAEVLGFAENVES